MPLSGFMLEDDFALKLFRECASLLETKLKNRVKAVKNVPSPGFMLEDDFSFKLFCECALLPKKRHFYKQQKWHSKTSGPEPTTSIYIYIYMVLSFSARVAFLPCHLRGSFLTKMVMVLFWLNLLKTCNEYFDPHKFR